MIHYCMSCGAKNEYRAIKPEKCVKCQSSFGSFKPPVRPTITQQQEYISQPIVDNEETYVYDLDIEPVSEREMQMFTVANSARKIKLGDAAPNLKANAAQEAEKPKKRGRPKKS